MSSSDTVARTLVAHTTVVNGLRITMNWFQSTFIVPNRIPDDDDFVAAILFLGMLGASPVTLAFDYPNSKHMVACWENGQDLPPPEARLTILRIGFNKLGTDGIAFGRRRFSASTGMLLSPT